MEKRIVWLSLLVSGCCMGGGAPAAPGSPTAPVAAPVVAAPPVTPIAEGSVVLANYHDLGRYYVGVVTAVNGGQLSILYADGDAEVLAPSSVMPDRLVGGIPGEAFDGTAFVPVTIGRRVGHALGIVFADGRRQWISIARVRVAAAALPAIPPPAEPLLAAPFGDVGSIALARYTGDGHWYEAVVGEIVTGDLRRMIYADGSSEDLPMTALRPGGITVGARVDSRAHRATTSEPGTVLRRVAHGVEVQLDNGTRRWSGLGNVRIAP